MFLGAKSITGTYCSKCGRKQYRKEPGDECQYQGCQGTVFLYAPYRNRRKRKRKPK